MTRSHRAWIAALFAVAAALGIVLLERGRERSLVPDRTIHLSMKGYAFNGTNPTLTFKPGERVRFVLTNDEETPVRHDFSIEALGVHCSEGQLPGERREVIVTLPRSGEFDYTCCTHRGMGGKIVIAR